MPEVLTKYNEHQISTKHASPEELRKDEEMLQIASMEDFNRGQRAINKMAEFSIGDKVRVREKPADRPRDRAKGSKPSDKIAKGSERWSNKVYSITGIDKYSFELVDSDGKATRRTYRQHELM